MNQFGPFVQYPYRDHRFWDSHDKSLSSGASYYQTSCASADDVLITDGTGMTGVVNKFQRILGLKVPKFKKFHHDSSRKETNCLYFAHGTPFESNVLVGNYC
jgi:hypothetical protein